MTSAVPSVVVSVRSGIGARTFAEGSTTGSTAPEQRPTASSAGQVVQCLPRRQTRVATWPVVTVFGAIARPKLHVFVKPDDDRRAAAAYGFDLCTAPRRGGRRTRASRLRRGHPRGSHDLGPRDQIDVQSFLWVLGSDEYADERHAARRSAVRAA